jgi:glucose-1-phosphate thymidylyltransferase
MGQLAAGLPKSLLLLAGKPAIDHVLDRLNEIDPVRIFLTTNLRFKSDFESWLAEKGSHKIELVVEPDDYLVICGDNIFTSSLVNMLEYYQRKRKALVAVYLQKSLDDVKLGSAVTLGEDNRIVSFEEKPDHPKTRLVGACIYILPYKSLLRTRQYLDEGGNRDEPGNFIAWLRGQEDVYGYFFEGYVWDLGTPKGYECAQKEFASQVMHQSKQ